MLFGARDAARPVAVKRINRTAGYVAAHHPQVRTPQFTMPQGRPYCELAMTLILKFYDQATCAGFIA
jgi:hypothetical protein